LHELFAADGLRGPHVLLVSGTSWAGTSDRYHVQVPVDGILRAPDTEVEAIRASRFAFRSFRDPETGAPLTVSGKLGDERDGALRAIVHRLADRSALGGPSILERERAELDEDRQRILLVTGNYAEAEEVCRALVARRPDWQGAVRYLVSDDEGAEHWSGGGERLRRGDVAEFANTGAWILVAPLAAIERGHNILNVEKRAALGAAFFLVRPHPRPDDPGHVIHGIAHWALERDRLLARNEPGEDLIDRARAFRSAGFGRWRELLRTPMRFSGLGPPEREAFTWTQMISIWQVIGRLVRGGCAARVYFCDDAFAPLTGDGLRTDVRRSLLLSMRSVLEPYFAVDPSRPMSAEDRLLVQTLYQPLYEALCRLEGLSGEAEPSREEEHVYAEV
jgi:hypothetical protein